jgi:hypothetical protein
MVEFVANLTPRRLPDAFTRAYFEAMEWTDCNADHPDMAAAEGFSETLRAAAVADCAAFQEAYAADLEAAYETGYTEEQAGIDFWLTRNRHGAGFWSRRLGEIGERLSDAAHRFGGVDLYAGDDNFIYG